MTRLSLTSALVVSAGCSSACESPTPHGPGQSGETDTGVGTVTGDLDGDGYTALQGDCNDQDPETHPDAYETIGDAIDSDCDGGDSVSESLSGYPCVVSPSAEEYLQFGFSLSMGDVDGDADSEVLVGSQAFTPFGSVGAGEAWLLDGAALSPRTGWVGRESFQYLGQAVAIADAGSDTPSLLMLSDDGVWIVPASAPGGDPLSVGAYLLSADYDSFVSYNHVAALGVLGTQGDDVLTACGTLEDIQEGAGFAAVCVVEGPIRGHQSLGESDLVISGAPGFGSAMIGTDLDGDGVTDLMIGAPDVGLDAGALYAYSGPLFPGVMEEEDAVGVWTGENPGDWFGFEAASGDFDSDGDGDAIVSAKAWPGHDRRGRVYAIALETSSAADAGFLIDGDAGPGDLGSSIASADFDADGDMDLAVGSSSYVAPSLPGRALIFLGPLRGHLDANTAEQAWRGEAPGDAAGSTVASGDVDGDGLADLVVASPYNDSASVDSGKLCVISGPLTP